jgi:hypothetical protein
MAQRDEQIGVRTRAISRGAGSLSYAGGRAAATKTEDPWRDLPHHCTRESKAVHLPRRRRPPILPTPCRTCLGPVVLAMFLLLPDAEPLPPRCRGGERRSLDRHASPQQRLRALLQRAPRSRRASLSGRYHAVLVGSDWHLLELSRDTSPSTPFGRDYARARSRGRGVVTRRWSAKFPHRAFSLSSECSNTSAATVVGRRAPSVRSCTTRHERTCPARA